MIRALSPKQREVLTWWRTGSEEALICDGAVRSGKTLCMGLAFFLWAMTRFQNERFALCGKTVQGVRRNLLSEVLPLLTELGLRWKERRSEHLLTVSDGGRQNQFYLFGGKDEGSAALIQGITLAGALLDEVALMPRSFVEQTCARCSKEGGKLWFSCNPEGPEHWFYKEWIQKAAERNARYLHFTMEDNPGLSPRVRQRYERAFRGTFYRRFILGEWVAAEGRVYDFWDESMAGQLPEGPGQHWCISCDYGTVNPASFGLWGEWEGRWYRVAEYYYDARREGHQKTDEEYAEALERLAGGREIELVVVDPSAASFIETLRRRGLKVVRARNEVLDGIRLTAELLKRRQLVICKGCRDILREFQLYRWEPGGGDRVHKEHDHAMDDMRYFAATVVGAEPDRIYAGSVERRRF